MEITSSREPSPLLASAGIRVSKKRAQHEISNTTFSAPKRVTRAERAGLTVLSLDLGTCLLGYGDALFTRLHVGQFWGTPNRTSILITSTRNGYNPLLKLKAPSKHFFQPLRYRRQSSQTSRRKTALTYQRCSRTACVPGPQRASPASLPPPGAGCSRACLAGEGARPRETLRRGSGCEHSRAL